MQVLKFSEATVCYKILSNRQPLHLIRIRQYFKTWLLSLLTVLKYYRTLSLTCLYMFMCEHIYRADWVPDHISVPEDGDEVRVWIVGVFEVTDHALGLRGRFRRQKKYSMFSVTLWGLRIFDSPSQFVMSQLFSMSYACIRFYLFILFLCLF
jgi:hypothetical protein